MVEKMKITKMKKVILLTIVTVLIVLMLTSITSKTNAYTENLYLGLEEYRSSGYAYKSLTDKVMWKISEYNSLTGPLKTKEKTIYCIKAGPGFGSTTDMGSGTTVIRQYSEAYDLKNLTTIPELNKTVLPTGQNYKSLIWVLEHSYVPALTTASEDIKQQAVAFRAQLLQAAGIPSSKLSDDEIDIVQQLAVWYFTNNTTGDPYKVEDETFSLWIKQKDVDSSYQSIGNKFGYAGDDRQDDAQVLFSYFITNAQNAGAPTVNTNVVSITKDSATAKLFGDNYIVGPYRINQTNSSATYDISLDLTTSDGTRNISYTLLNSSKETTSASLKDLVGQDFYLSIPKTQNIENAKMKITTGVYQTNIIYRSVSGVNAGVDQPVVEIIRTKNPYYINLDIPNLSEFDLALRKFITSVNGKELKDNEGKYIREPIIDVTNLVNGTSTTAIKDHPKNPLMVKKGDTVLYTIRVYNEGNLNGYVKEITDYLPAGLKLKEGSSINIENGWTNPSNDGKTIVTTKLAGTLLNKFNGTTLDCADVQVECEVIAEDSTTKLKNIAEISKHSDENGVTNIVDRDSQPNSLTEDQKNNYGTTSKQDDDDFEDLIITNSKFDLALRKFITKINNEDVSPSREPDVDIEGLKNGSTTAIKEHPKNPLQVKNGDIVLYTIRVYNEGNVNGYVKEITDYLPSGLKLKEGSSINTENGWENPSNDGKTIVTNKLAGTLLNKFDGTTLDCADVQVECEVIAEYSNTDVKLKNIAEITIHSDESGDTTIVDRDSTPNNLTEQQKDNYNPGTSEQGWGYEDDDDFEDLILPAKYFDLALRKFITNVNGRELVDNNGKYIREPIIDVTNLANGTSTTAEYKHRKDPVGVAVGDIVIYNLRVYNEGQIDGYANTVTDYLPPQLEFVIDDEENFNAQYGWLVDSTLRKATTSYLSKERDEEENLIKAFDSRTMSEPDYKELKIKCRVKSVVDLQKVITNIAEITDFVDKNGNKVIDRDSTADSLTKDNSKPEDNIQNDNLPTDENLPDYKGNDDNKSILSDSDYHYKGQQDDDDFEKLILQEFDLALRKFITGVNDKRVTDRIPEFTTNKDENGNYIYEHTKEPIEVDTTDIVEYTIRIYNEGDIAGYAKEVKDDIPSGLEFLPENELNEEYRWKMLDKDGNETKDIKEAESIVTDYLSKEQEDETGRINLIKAFDTATMTSPAYKEVKVAFKVIAPNTHDGIITNIAEISKDSDEDGNDIEDKDSTPDNGNEKEDDIDKEHIKLTYFDLALRKFITAVNDKEIKDRVPVFKIDENGKYVYEHTKEPVDVENGNIVTYTLRIFNEGTKDGYAKQIKDDLPEGLLFLPENELNKEYRWKMLDKDGKETTKVEEAESIVTDYLSKEQADATGRDNLLKAFDEEKMKEPNHKDIKIAFKVTEPNTSDRILINKAQISDDSDKNGNDVIDKDSTPDKWIDEEDDQDIEKVKVKYFDLSLRKWVTQAIVIENGKETVTDTGHKAEDDPEAPVKVEIVASKINKVVIKFKYKIRITNEGEIAGAATEISDYIPEGLKFVAADNPNWKEVDGKIVTDQLKDTILQPKESAEVEVLLTWINGKDNMGLKVNVAEISKDWNDSDTPDIDSTPNNKKDGEDDIDDAPVILSVKTGSAPTYIGLIAGTLIILAGGVALIKKYVI